MRVSNVKLLVKGSAEHAESTNTFPVIHISGASGTGKNYLKNLIKKKHPDVMFVNVNDLIRDNMLMEKADMIINSYKGNNDKERQNKIQESADTFASLFMNLVEDIVYKVSPNKPVIFLGLPHIDYDVIYTAPLWELCSHKFFIDIDTTTHIKQILKKHYTDKICKNKKFLDNVVKGYTVINAIDRGIVEHTQKFYNELYVKNFKYKPIKHKKLLSEINKIL